MRINSKNPSVHNNEHFGYNQLNRHEKMNEARRKDSMRNFKHTIHALSLCYLLNALHHIGYIYGI